MLCVADEFFAVIVVCLTVGDHGAVQSGEKVGFVDAIGLASLLDACRRRL